ncbi:MAG: cell division protein FtsX [Thermoanaerobaculaceae bacterium]
MNRHGWREVQRQVRESGAPGGVAILMVAVATAWGGLLLTVHRWVERDLLGHRQASTVVAVLHEPKAATSLAAALEGRQGNLRWVLAQPAQVRQELAEWFPELATVLLALDEPSFPALLKVEVDPDAAGALASWLAARREVAVVQSSAQWQARVEQALGKVIVVGFALASVLLAGCFLVVLLVVRLLVLDHADEIAIMRLIGARERDIRLPYAALGLVLGCTGGLLGVLTLAILKMSLQSILPALTPEAYVLVAMPLAGAAAGAGGAALGLLAIPHEP